jgi:hypothetical protein
LLLQKDLHELFDYIEPSDTNFKCYSYRIHELLLRACIEFEANCRAILSENGYVKRNKHGSIVGEQGWNIKDYFKINPSHQLSEYEVRLPTWYGTQGCRRPFASWHASPSLPWFQAYNATKHNRHDNFQEATFEQMLDAMCGLVVLLSSQFITEDFSYSNSCLYVSGSPPSDGMESAIGGYFRVKFPINWSAADRYDLDWRTMQSQPDPFQHITFPP